LMLIIGVITLIATLAYLIAGGEDDDEKII
jgi:hypothetical protein